MRATCPSCDAVYEIPDRLIGGGRRLRCTNCGHEWTLLPAVAEAPPPPRETPDAPAASPPPGPMLRRPPQVIDPPLPPVDDHTGMPRGGTALLKAAWVGSLLLVALAFGALWAFRHEIATAWPPAARLTGATVGGG